eukprot:1790195-Amphidinium_carterae.7
MAVATGDFRAIMTELEMDVITNDNGVVQLFDHVRCQYQRGKPCHCRALRGWYGGRGKKGKKDAKGKKCSGLLTGKVSSTTHERWASLIARTKCAQCGKVGHRRREFLEKNSNGAYFISSGGDAGGQDEDTVIIPTKDIAVIGARREVTLLREEKNVQVLTNMSNDAGPMRKRAPTSTEVIDLGQENEVVSA